MVTFECLEFLPRLFPPVRSYLFSFNRVFSSPISRKAAHNRSWEWFDCSGNRSSDSESLLSGTRYITLSGLWSRSNALGYCRIFVNPTNSTLLTAITYRTEQRSLDRPSDFGSSRSSNNRRYTVSQPILYFCDRTLGQIGRQRDNSRAVRHSSLWKNFATLTAVNFSGFRTSVQKNILLQSLIDYL